MNCHFHHDPLGGTWGRPLATKPQLSSPSEDPSVLPARLYQAKGNHCRNKQEPPHYPQHPARCSSETPSGAQMSESLKIPQPWPPCRPRDPPKPALADQQLGWAVHRSRKAQSNSLHSEGRQGGHGPTPSLSHP
jgi:hypothetical protein